MHCRAGERGGGWGRRRRFAATTTGARQRQQQRSTTATHALPHLLGSALLGPGRRVGGVSLQQRDGRRSEGSRVGGEKARVCASGGRQGVGGGACSNLDGRNPNRLGQAGQPRPLERAPLPHGRLAEAAGLGGADQRCCEHQGGEEAARGHGELLQ